MIKKKLLNIKKVLTTADVVLVVVLLVLSLFLFYKIGKKSSQQEVEIYFHNQLIKKVPLSQNREIKISDGIIAEIRNGKVRMKKSTCKHQYCVKQGWTDSFPIICVPNEILCSQ
ncbi:MAG: hypothetical protein B6D62_03220 [Candidatus Cloacimonas sp. 4484_275]|nr:MAG: hypothetical protein B6D62_03220 [Candidatus Cloacimonas sp. 4484_275]